MIAALNLDKLKLQNLRDFQTKSAIDSNNLQA